LGVPRTLPAVTVGTSLVPAVSGPIIVATGYSVLNNIVTVYLGAGNLPPVGYNGPDGFRNFEANGGRQDLYGNNRGQGQQVALWGWTTATFLNGLVITVLDHDLLNGSFRFYYTTANAAYTADAGNTAADTSVWNGGASASQPGIAGGEHFRVVRIELDASAGGNIVYVGDQNVSSSRYFEALSLTGQVAIEVASQNIPGSRIWLVASASTVVHISLIF
jgi:hypothetical protein